MDKPLPCIICGFQPENATGGHGIAWQPYAATMFDAGSGNYGSTVWDEMNSMRSLHINVCDKCLVERKDRVAIIETVPQAPRVQTFPWRAGVKEA